jgi:hypothetical protein
VIASASDDKTVKLWDIEKHCVLQTYFDHTAEVNSVEFHPDGTCLASGSADCSIKLWDCRSHQLLQHYATVYSCPAFIFRKLYMCLCLPLFCFLPCSAFVCLRFVQTKRPPPPARPCYNTWISHTCRPAIFTSAILLCRTPLSTA